MSTELLTNKWLSQNPQTVENSYGTKFTIGDVVSHEGAKNGEEAKILGFFPSSKYEPEICAKTTEGDAHIDFLFFKEK